MRITAPKTWLAMALMAAAVAAPAAHAEGSSKHALTSAAARPGPLQTRQQTEGALGSPVTLASTVSVARSVIESRAGFDWGDASVGAGFILGLGLFAAVVGLMLRRRGLPARVRQ